EIMVVTAGAGTTSWTVTRGQDGTTAATAASGASVFLVTGPLLYGIFPAASTSTAPGKPPAASSTWPWPASDNASGTVAGTLSKYLTTHVYAPASVENNPPRFLQTSDTAFKQIMRLYSWDYVIDNIGAPCAW